MTYNPVSCPECGHSLDTEETCGACGFYPAAPDDAAGWLELGSSFELSLKASALKLPGVSAQDTAELTLTLEMVEIWEDFEDRRVLLAETKGWSGMEHKQNDERFCAELKALELVIEQQSLDSTLHGQRLPEQLARQVRRAVARRAYQNTELTVFRNTGGLALDELVEVGVGRLNLAQIKALFLPLLESIATIHEQGLVHLRLTPWSVRVRDPLSPQGIPLAFLRDVMKCGDQARAGMESGRPATKQGWDERAERDEELSFGDVDPPHAFGATPAKPEYMSGASAENSAPELSDAQVVQDDTDEIAIPAGLSERERLIGEPSWAEVELQLLFDGVEGFLTPQEDLELLPFTPSFSAPELLSKPEAAELPACDVFSLGMLLYFLVAGQPAPVSVYTRQAPALPARNLRPEFPPGLQAIIGRATRPLPEERYPSVIALKRAFELACDAMEARAHPKGPPPRAQVAADTHTGLGKRRRNPVNQDAVFTDVSEDGELALVVVADGVSTASFGSGDLASGALAAEARATWAELNEAYLQDQLIEPRRVLQGILNRVNERIIDYVNSRYSPFLGAAHEVMGTTALLALVFNGEVTLATLGDSRVYLARGEAFEQLTIDHNLWTLSILDGVPADDALAMAHGEALARCVGTFVIQDERLEPLDPEPDFMRFKLIRGDTLLFTTDGLIDFAAVNMLAAEDHIHNILVSEPDPGLACLELILLANRGGGGDNIGVGIVKFT